MATQSARWISTARVLRRAGFGATGAEIDAAQSQDPRDYLGAALAAGPNSDPGAQVTAVPTFTQPQRVARNASADVRKQANAERSSQISDMTSWWIRRMVAVQQPLAEKLTLVWHNHFATSTTKVRNASAMTAQNDKLRTLGTGDFWTLAYAMLTDPAMLEWLDGTRNTAKAPNENLSREFMELFALGHGNGYTEADVRAGARALTGWTIGPDGAGKFVPTRHDAGPKTVLGVSGPLDAGGFCDAVLAAPGAPRFLAGRMWRYLASDTPPSQVALDRVTAAYAPQRNLTNLILAVLTDDEFTSGQSTVVVGPVEWMIGAVRALQVPVPDDKAATKLASAMRNLGQLPFAPPNVGGWPYGQAWLSTASARTRLATASDLVAHADLGAVAAAARADRIDAAGHLLGIGAWSDRSAAVLRDYVDHPDKLVVVALNTPEYLTA